MAKNNQEQVSLFDDEQLLELALINIQLLQQKLTDNPGTSLSVEEKDYVVNLGKATTLNEAPIKVEKLEGKKVSPFSKMVLSVAQTFSNATKALREYREFVNSPRSQQINILNSSAEEASAVPDVQVTPEAKVATEAKVDSSGNRLMQGVSSFGKEIDSGVREFDRLKNKAVDGVSARVSRGVRSVEAKTESAKVNFMDFYDGVSLSAMKVRDNVKDTVINAKNKIEGFAKLFEDPMIQVKFKGTDGLTIDKVSYNTGLFLGKSKVVIEEKMKALAEVIMKKPNVEPVPANTSTIIGSKLEPVMSASEPLRSSEEVAPVVSAPEVVKESNEPVIAVAEPVVPESEMSKRIDTALDQQQGIDNSLNTPNDTPPGDTVKEPKENKTWFSKLKNFFKIEFESTEYQKKVDAGLIVPEVKKPTYVEPEPEVVVGSVVKPEDTSLFKLKENGAYPEVVDTFRDTSRRLEKDLGLRVTEEGTYTFDKLNYDKSGNKMSAVQKMIILKDVIAPNIVKHTQEASDILFSLNEASKNNPAMKAFRILSSKTGGDTAALGMIEAAMHSKSSAFDLKRIGGAGVEDLLNDLPGNFSKIKKDIYVLDVATLNLKNVINFGNIVKDEAHFVSTQNGLVNNVSASINNHVLREFDNGRKVKLIDIVQSFSKMDFSKTQATPGNEDIVFRVLDKRDAYEKGLEAQVLANREKSEQNNFNNRRENVVGRVNASSGSDRQGSFGASQIESPPSSLSDAAGYDATSLRLRAEQKIEQSAAWKIDQDRILTGSASVMRPYQGLRQPVENPNIYVAAENMGMNHQAEKTPVVVKGEIGSAPKPETEVSLEVNTQAIDEARNTAPIPVKVSPSAFKRGVK